MRRSRLLHRNRNHRSDLQPVRVGYGDLVAHGASAIGFCGVRRARTQMTWRLAGALALEMYSAK